MDAPPSLSLVIPVYNEAPTVEQAVKRVVGALVECTSDFEIILVESGSTDGTRALAERLAREDSRIRVIHEMNREGYGSAIKLGLSNATKDVICYIDADEPFNVSAIGEGLRALDHADVVIGYRIGPRENLRRLAFSRVYNLMIRWIFGLRVRDVNFSFKAFRRPVIDAIRVRSRGAFIDAELLLETVRGGFTIHEHGFPFTPRKIGDSSLFRMSVVWNILVEMAQHRLATGRLKRRQRPGAQDSDFEVVGANAKDTP